MGQFIGSYKPDGYNTEEELERMSREKEAPVQAINDMQIVYQAVCILQKTGGSLESFPHEHRKWKIRNADCVCNSVSLTRACLAFIDDYKSRLEGTLP